MLMPHTLVLALLEVIQMGIAIARYLGMAGKEQCPRDLKIDLLPSSFLYLGLDRPHLSTPLDN